MAEMRKLSKEVQIREEHHRLRHAATSVGLSEERRDDHVTCGVLSVIGMAAKSKLEFDERSLQPERVHEWSPKLPFGAFSEQRSEMTRRSEEELVDSGRDVRPANRCQMKMVIHQQLLRRR